MTLPEIAHQLRGRKSGAGWVAKCPAHEDSNPSLSIKLVDGKILAHCYAGCDQRAVLEALKAQGLWPKPAPRNIDRIVATYDYTDESGELLYQVVRLEPKDFCQRRPDGSGGWIWRKSPQQVLYHIREVLEAPIVICGEGERDVETLRAHGFVATTNAGGANTPWFDQYTETLRGREVILIPDNDPPGCKRVLAIATALLGRAARIVVVELEGAKDVSEWFDRGHSETELIAQMGDLTNAR